MKKNLSFYTISTLILTVVLGIATIPMHSDRKKVYSASELKKIMVNHPPMPIDSNTMFPTANVCGGCHGNDLQDYALVDANGNDINMYNQWQPTMMANSAKDPFWRAKVSHETFINPEHKEAIEDKCTSCHASMGHYQATLRGAAHYGMTDLLQDTTGLDGVSCQSCHAQAAGQIGTLHSGNINFDTTRVAYGPYQTPFEGPMDIFVGIKPIYSAHINDAGLCASCHTLITDAFDLNNEPTGTTAVEQATYHEWLNSSYKDENITCQNCHMRRINDEVIIAYSYPFLLPRTPYGMHELAGANTLMLKLMKSNKTALGITADDIQYDSTIARTQRMLQEQTLDMNLAFENIANDTAFFRLQLNNKAGHKFPSGYPSRRAVVEFIVTTPAGDTLFKSGVLNDQYEVIGEDSHFEPHHDIISSPEQVQIYESVFGDVTGQFTTVLDRFYTQLKDNRLTPIGFTIDDPRYDTTQIVGAAFSDPDFNRSGNLEGTGSDIIHYHIPTGGYQGQVNVSARVWYQSLPPRWMQEIFSVNTPEIMTFKNMYDEADRSPVLVASASLSGIDWMTNGQANITGSNFSIFPNPASNGKFQILAQDNERILKIRVLDTEGKELPGSQYTFKDNALWITNRKGIFFVVIETERGRYVEKVLVL